MQNALKFNEGGRNCVNKTFKTERQMGEQNN